MFGNAKHTNLLCKNVSEQTQGFLYSHPQRKIYFLVTVEFNLKSFREIKHFWSNFQFSLTSRVQNTEKQKLLTMKNTLAYYSRVGTTHNKVLKDLPVSR
jgi:hypothetical protein